LLARSWRSIRRSPLPWATLPFVLVHTALAHKEERFLFPLAMLLPWILVDALTADGRLVFARRRWHAPLRAYNLGIALLLAVYPLGWRPHHLFFEYVASLGPEVRLVSREPGPLRDHPFLAQQPWEERRLGREPPPLSWAGWHYVTADPFASPEPPAGARLELAWSELPGRTVPGVWRTIGPWLSRALVAWTTSTPPSLPRPTWMTVWRIVPEPST
jgi:phosphatidylinositol glycan class B